LNSKQNVIPGEALAAYLDFLSTHPDGDEVQYRTPLENLINAVKLPSRVFSIVQEDRKSDVDVDGIPDFFVYEDDKTLFKRLIGFIECKKPSYRIEKVLESEQIKKYAKSCENIIITNYTRFILLQRGRIIHDIVLSNEQTAGQNFISLIFDFYQYEYPYIADKKTLAKTLAGLSFYFSVALREFIKNTKDTQSAFYIKFNALFTEYQQSLNYHYELVDFCDIYAQSFAYALFLARLESDITVSESSFDFLASVPAEYKLLREFLSQGYTPFDVPAEIKMRLANIGKNINLINTAAIEAEFAKTAIDKSGIAVYLYEDYLGEYDILRGTENRKEGGVYYTPKEAADFIIRGVDYIIKNEFNLAEGLAAQKVKTLDFACGTGTFLQSVIEHIVPQNSDDLARGRAKEKIINDIYGFEVLWTPYIIAHTVLTRFLAGCGIHLENDDRLGIYLTNTLDIQHHSISALLPHLKQEYEKSINIKETETILAIVGNPPYFGGSSRANTDLIDAKVYDYKKNLESETNLQPLDDMYIKFIRFAEWKIEKSGEGVVGIIVNNSFIDGLVHRSMRRHLYETFDEIYILNLHGNSNKKEGDKNIFDIRIGVSILIFIKHKIAPPQKNVFYYSMPENGIITRMQKLKFLRENTLTQVKWRKISTAATKNYWFVKKDFTGAREYKKFVKITDIFAEYCNGIETGNDSFCLKYTCGELDALKKEAENTEIHIIRNKYKVTDTRRWHLADALNDIKKIKDAGGKTKCYYNPICIQYRPFDYRWTSLSGKSHRFLEHPRYKVMRHFENAENIGICFLRKFGIASPYTNIFVSQYPIEKIAIITYGSGSYFAPLYLYSDNLSDNGKVKNGKRPNWTADFQKNYLAALSWKPSPDDVFAYIYAVLSSPVYREKYIEFLKTDFPAIPLTREKSLFEKYARWGRRLIELHTLKKVPAFPEIKVSLGGIAGSFVIEKQTFTNETLRLDVRYGEKLYTTGVITIEGVAAAVYDFELGSRKPAFLWLKNRIKDKVSLTLDDIHHLKTMLCAIKETLAVTAEIAEDEDGL
jgi:predicted helicase